VCDRFASFKPPEAIGQMFGTTGPIPNIDPNWNVVPGQPALVVRRHPASGERRLDQLQWGLLPHFAHNTRGAHRHVNAAAETAALSDAFRDALTSRRALVPVDAFYEWEGSGLGKHPYAAARKNGQVIAFAGLWESWRSMEGEILRTFTLITTQPNREISLVHDSMPVILEAEDWPIWLGEVEGAYERLMRPAPDGVLDVWPVSRALNSTRSQGPQLLKRVEVQEPH
jgi:putative SOS response-associated peptidase YedK